MKRPRKAENERLEVKVIRGRLIISIGIRTLAFAATESNENFQRGEEGQPMLRVVAALTAAHDVARVLRDEEEDGSTMVTALLDKAITKAWEDGGEGFDETPAPVPARPSS